MAVSDGRREQREDRLLPKCGDASAGKCMYVESIWSRNATARDEIKINFKIKIYKVNIMNINELKNSHAVIK